MESLAYLVVGIWIVFLFISIVCGLVLTRYFYKWRYIGLLIALLIPFPSYGNPFNIVTFLFFGGVSVIVCFLTILLTSRWIKRKNNIQK